MPRRWWRWATATPGRTSGGGRVDGGPLDHTASKVAAAPLGCRLSVRLSGAVGASLILELADLDAFVADPGGGADVVGGIDVPAWGYRPFVDGRVVVTPTDEGRSIVVSATVRVGDDLVAVTMSTTLPDRGMGRRRWQRRPPLDDRRR